MRPTAGGSPYLTQPFTSDQNTAADDIIYSPLIFGPRGSDHAARDSLHAVLGQSLLNVLRIPSLQAKGQNPLCMSARLAIGRTVEI
jgi:hypothetical protein